MEMSHGEIVKVTGKPLGALLYYSPVSNELKEIMAVIENGSSFEEWPFGEAEELKEIQSLIAESVRNKEKINEDYKRLFVGPDKLSAPPWGSVYLDRESVIFGCSTLELRQWQKEHGISTVMGAKEPEDHIGLMLMLASYLAENQEDVLQEYLADHLFPWCFRYLKLLEKHADTPFYKGLARLSALTLNGWKDLLSVTPQIRKLYF